VISSSPVLRFRKPQCHPSDRSRLATTNVPRAREGRVAEWQVRFGPKLPALHRWVLPSLLFAASFASPPNICQAAIAPTVTTTAADTITTTSANLNGNVTPNGSATTVWFEYGTSSLPPTSAPYSTNPGSAGSGTTSVHVNANLTGLTSNTTYFFRLVGQNTAGTVRGQTLSFTTSVNVPPVPTGLTPGGTSPPGATVTSLTPTLNWNASAGATQYAVVVLQVSSGATILAQSVSATSITCPTLQNGVTYIWSVSASNSTGSSAASTGVYFTVSTGQTAPTVTTTAADTITTTSANLNGNVTPNGSATTVWFEYGTSSLPPTSAPYSTNPGSAGSGTTSVHVNANLTGLTSNTTYFFRLVGQNTAGTVRGQTLSFTTPPGTVPGNLTLSNQTPVCDQTLPAGPAVQLNWTASSGATSYQVYRNGSPIGSSTTGTAFYNNVGLTAGSTYSYFVGASNANGTTDSNTIPVSIPANICQPTTQQLTLDITPAGTQTVSSGQFVSFTAAVSAGGAPVSGASVPVVDGVKGAAVVNLITGSDGTAPYQTSASNAGSYSVMFGPATKQGYTSSASMSRSVVVQSCTITPSPLTMSVSPTGGTYSISVSAAQGCSWTAGTDTTWASIAAGASGSGNGSVGISVSASFDAAPRTATITIGGIAVTINQSSCSIDGITPPNANFTNAAATGSVAVMATGCPWNAVSNESWLTVTSGSTSTGNASLGYSVAANSGATRNGSIRIKSLTFTVTQTGTCIYTITPSTLAPGYRGDTGVIMLSNDQNCTWSASSNSAWASVSPSSGTGAASIVYTIQQNGGTASRNAVFNIAGQNVQIQEAGNPLPSCQPAVNTVQRQYSGYFLPFGDVPDRFDVTVAWCAAPGSVKFDINGVNAAIESATGSVTSHLFHMTEDFPAQFAPSVVTITPISSDGTAGQPWTEQVYVFGLPSWLEVVGLLPSVDITSNGVTYGWSFQFPDPPISNANISFPSWVPFLGGEEFGLKNTSFSVGASVSSSGSGSGSVSGSTGFTAFGSDLDGTVGGSANFSISPSAGLMLQKATVNLGITGTITKDESVLDVLATILEQPELAALPDSFKDHAMIEAEISPSLNTTVGFSQQNGSLAFDAAAASIGLELGSNLKVDVIDGVSATAWVNGSGTTTFGFPQPYLRALNLTFGVGVEAELDFQFCISILCAGQDWNPQASIGYSCNWQAGGAQLNCRQSDTGEPTNNATAFRLRNRSSKNTELRPIHRKYERWGPYASLSHPQFAQSPSRTPAGKSAVSGQLGTAGNADTNQQLVQNIFPGANPQLVHAGSLDLLVLTYQNPTLPPEESTDIAWSTNDGTGWSPLAFIAQDTQLEMSPVSGVDRNGNVVTAWKRVKDPTWAQTIQTLADLEALQKEIEVVYAVFNPNSRTWSSITQLTDDTAFDTDLHLSTDSAGGLMLTWLSNPGGEFTSTAANPSTIKYSFWNGSSFSTPVVAMSGLVGVSRHAAALDGSRAVIIIQRDAPAGTGASDVLDLLSWNGTTWSVSLNYAASGENRLPSAVFDNAGTVHIVWVQNDQLVHTTLQQSTPDVIRDSADSMAFYDAHLMVNPAGNLTLVWQQAISNGDANLFARIFDPVTSTWSADVRLNELAGMSHGVSGYYSIDGILQLCYLQTLVEQSSQLMPIDGSSVLLENVPMDGRTDIYTLSHLLAVDLAVANSDLQITPAIPAPGAQVGVQLTVHNAGSLPVSFVHANVYAGTIKVTTLTSETALAAGDICVLTGQFTYPAGGGDVVVIVNEEHAFTELTYDNNQAVIQLTNSVPSAKIAASAVTGVVPFSVDFDATGSVDPSGSSLTFNWVFSDGSPIAAGAKVSHVFGAAGTYSVALSATNAQGTSSTATVFITVVASDAPTFTANGVVDAASFASGISPGSIASLFGVRLSSELGVASAQSFPLPVQLQGTSVTVNGMPAPLLAVANVAGSEQINFQVPFETAAPGQAQIVVSSGGNGSAPIDVPVLPAKPAVFVIDGIGPVIVHNLTGAMVTSTNPARPGETVVIYCTGLGPVAPQVSTGAAASTTQLSWAVLPFGATVGGTDAVIGFAGLAPTFAGLYQVNLVIPSGLTGTSMPLVIQVNGSSSLPVSLPIAP
jgi:uncharacterized protein (TIGR03437 family)